MPDKTREMFLAGVPLPQPLIVPAAETGRYSAENPPTTNISKQQSRVIPGLSRRNAKLTAYTQDTAGVIRKSTTPVGRNDICPCGSGMKFKRCCGKTPQVTRLSPLPKRKEEEPAAEPLRTTDAADAVVPLHDVFVQLIPTFADHPEHVYAYLATGRVISPSTRDSCTEEELQEYDAAIRRWSEMSTEQQEAERANWARYAQDATTWPHAKEPGST